MKRLSNYKEFVSESEISRIYRKGTELSKYHILHINSSYYGGGIAEILRNMVPLLNEIGVEVGWRAMVGSPDFFRVCKRFHNSLLGEGIDLTEMKKKVYEGTNEDFSRFTHIDHDLVIVHNHQPLPLIRFLQKRQPWIWRCHEDLSTPNEEVLDYLKSFIIPFDKCVFQTGKCIFSDFQKECSFVNPTIDPLSTKNEYLDDNKIKKYLNRIGIDLSRPIVSQVSEFDKHKDPIGALEVFKRINEEMDCQFILIGSVSRYDPEGENIYVQVREKVKGMENVSLVLDPHDIFINSVQSASDVVLQKSLKEGFGLAVSEALWKETPVVGSKVGGITMQIVDGENGYLVDPRDYNEAAEKIMDILSDDDLRERMGRRGKEIIKDRFLITHQIENWLDIWREML